MGKIGKSVKVEDERSIENCDKLLADELSKWKIERRRTRRKKKNKSDGE